MILPAEEIIEEEEEEETNQPQVRENKKVETQAHDLFKEFVEEGFKILASSLKDKALEEPSDAKILEQHTKEVEATTETILKNAEGTFEYGILQLTIDAIEHEAPEANVGTKTTVEASDAVEVVNSGLF